MGCVQQTSNEYGFSVVIPVLNEAHHINSVISHLRMQNGSDDREIIVVDGDPAGETINAIEDSRTVKLTAPKGRGRQMNAGAAVAKGQILFFLHADTYLPPNAFGKVSKVLENQRYVAGAFDLGIDSDNFFIKAIALRARIRSRLTRVPYGDQTMFIRKEYFNEIGRFKEIPIMEDVDLMCRIRKRRDKIFILPDRTKTSARRWEHEGILYATLRNAVLVNLFRLGVSPHTLARYYHSGYNSSKK